MSATGTFVPMHISWSQIFVVTYIFVAHLIGGLRLCFPRTLDSGCSGKIPGRTSNRCSLGERRITQSWFCVSSTGEGKPAAAMAFNSAGKSGSGTGPIRTRCKAEFSGLWISTGQSVSSLS